MLTQSGTPVRLTNREHQTLMLLKRGHSEKEVADTLGISYHTVHDYVKSLHKRFNVCSRSELLSLWITPVAQESHA